MHQLVTLELMQPLSDGIHNLMALSGSLEDIASFRRRFVVQMREDEDTPLNHVHDSQTDLRDFTDETKKH